MLDTIKNVKPIENADGYYIHPDGKVYKIQEIAQTINNSGYNYVKLSTSSGLKSFSVHREVAKAFVENIDGHETVDHIDGDKSNNACGNLKWMSRAENIRKAYHIDVMVINELGDVKTVKNIRQFAQENRLDSSTLSKVLSGKLAQTGGWRLWNAR